MSSVGSFFSYFNDARSHDLEVCKCMFNFYFCFYSLLTAASNNPMIMKGEYVVRKTGRGSFVIFNIIWSYVPEDTEKNKTFS